MSAIAGATGHMQAGASSYDNRRFVADTLRVLNGMRGWIAVLAAIIAAKSALAPSVAWITKEVVEGLDQVSRDVIVAVVLQWGPVYLLIASGETVLKFIDKVLDKLIDIRLLIDLQRLYLDRRPSEVDGRDASQVLFGSRVANKGFDLIYKKSWQIVTTIVSVFVWQLTLGAEWMGLLVLSIVAPSLLVWKLGYRLQRLSSAILEQHEHIASNTPHSRRGVFEKAQDAWMATSIRFEIIKWVTDEGARMMLWLSLALIVCASYFLDLGLLPQTIDLATAAAFLVNLKLIAGPMVELSKMYSKWREAYPAMVAVYTGGDMAAPR